MNLIKKNLNFFSYHNIINLANSFLKAEEEEVALQAVKDQIQVINK